MLILVVFEKRRKLINVAEYNVEGLMVLIYEEYIDEEEGRHSTHIYTRVEAVK